MSYYGLRSDSRCGLHVCTSMIGGIAVAAVAWVTFVITTVLAVVHVMRTRRGGDKMGQEHAGWVGMQETTKV